MALPQPNAEVALTVRHARVIHAGAARGDVERWLSRVPVESLGLAADELFYVPRLKLRVPAGGAGGAFVPDRILAALRRLLAGAESGWGHGFSPDRPYRFTSRGRYFAWLVALWVKDGSAPARAAFAAATGQESLRQWQRTIALTDGAALVATVARLAEIGCAARWIARFEPADFALAHRALDQAFAVRFAAPAAAPMPGAAYAPAARAAAARAPQPPLPEIVARLAAAGNDWQGLPPPGRALLLATAAIADASSRSATQAAALATAVAAFATPQEVRSPSAASAAARPPAPRRRAGDRPIARGPTAHPPGAARTGEAMAIRRHAGPALAFFESGDAEPAAPTAAEAGNPPPARYAMAAAPALRGAAPPAPVLAPDTGFATGFGGLLFLVNAFVALGLYPDFTQPRGARLDPSPLWLADRIGRYRFGARYRDDPLAGWIAGHAAGGRLPRSWRVECDWLAGFGARPAPRLVRSRGRATLWDAAGFPIADAAVGRLRQDLRGLPLPRRPVPARSARPPFRLPLHSLDRWAACLALYLDARLRRFATGGLALLALPARIETRDLDLRAIFALDRYPVQLRLAGLDRDPGWQPAEGRNIGFVFE